MSKIYFATILILALWITSYFLSCGKSPISIQDNIVFKSKLSEYGIYLGTAGSLEYDPAYTPYTLPTQLFSDYAEKQRLIKLPASTKLTAADDGLPIVPDSTIIVKTFYYYIDKRDTALGKKIIETRLLIKNNGQWNAASYIWNTAQTDATFISAGADVPINWIDENGNPMVIAYHLPSKAECGMCHQSDRNITPIGIKIRNLNFYMAYNGSTINQLHYLQNKGVLAAIDPAIFTELPDWENNSYSLEQRARAYLDVNCGHCHTKSGLASHLSLKLTYQTPFPDSKIADKKQAINKLMSEGLMPLIGTTLIDKEGLTLIQNYLQTIR